MLSALVKIEPKHVNVRTKFLSHKVKNTTKYLQSLLNFPARFFLNFKQGDCLIN